MNLGLRVAAAVFSVPPEALLPMLPLVMMEPKAINSEIELRRNKFEEEVLPIAWNNARDGFHVDDEWIVNRYQTEDDTETAPPSTYGEVTVRGARQLFHFMDLYKRNQEKEKKVEFWDLGSGVGRLVIQSFIEIPSISRAVGIELCPSRHDMALRARSSILNIVKKERSRLDFIQGDILDTSNTITATHIYVASLCFTADMMHSLANILLSENNCPNIKTVASLQPIPFAGRKVPACRLEYIEMSWTPGQGSVVYIYDMKRRTNH